MLQGLRKVLARGARGQPNKSAAVDNSSRGAFSTAASDVEGHLFHLDEATEIAAATTSAAAAPGNDATAPRTDVLVKMRRDLLEQKDDSMHKRQAVAAQRRGARMDPKSNSYQVSVLLSLSTFFEHKLQSDTLRALEVARHESAAVLAAAVVPCPKLASGPRPDGGASSSSFSLSSSGPSGSGSSAASRARGSDVARVALALRRWGYTLIVRRVLHSKTYWTKSFDNTFIVALDTSSDMGIEYIVDPHFRELFCTGAMSPEYSAVWDSLPPVFVGMPCQLQPVVQLLCEEVELSFLDAGRPCPPWRGWAATINRWMSDQFVDVQVPGPGASDAEVAQFMERCTSAGAGAAPGALAAAASSSSPPCMPGPQKGPEGSPCLSGKGLPIFGQGPGGDHAHHHQQQQQQSGGLSGVMASTCATACSIGSRRLVQHPLRAQVGFTPPRSAVPYPASAAPPPVLPPLPPQQQVAPLEFWHVPAPSSPSSASEGDTSDLAIVYAAGSAADEEWPPSERMGAPLLDSLPSTSTILDEDEEDSGSLGDIGRSMDRSGNDGGCEQRQPEGWGEGGRADGAGPGAPRRPECPTSLLTVHLQQARAVPAFDVAALRARLTQQVAGHATASGAGAGAGGRTLVWPG